MNLMSNSGEICVLLQHFSTIILHPNLATIYLILALQVQQLSFSANYKFFSDNWQLFLYDPLYWHNLIMLSEVYNFSIYIYTALSGIV